MITTDLVLLNNWYPVVQIDDCQPGKILTTRLLGEDLVIWHPDTPETSPQAIQVWEDNCPHRGARLSLAEIKHQTLVCQYHGWEYDTSGQCVYIPAHPSQKSSPGAQVKTYHARERYGLLWVCLGTPQTDVPAFPEWDDPDYLNFSSDPHPVNASAFRMMENAMDIAHFPFVHQGILGDRSHSQVNDYQVEVDQQGMTISNMLIWLPGDETSNGTPLMLQKKLHSPLVEYTIMHTTGDSPQTITTDIVAITPIDDEQCKVWDLHTLNRAYEHLELQSGLGNKIIEQDIQVVESQRPARLPLLPRRETQTIWPEELHVPSDRYSIAYRRWLNQLGVTFGVC